MWDKQTIKFALSRQLTLLDGEHSSLINRCTNHSMKHRFFESQRIIDITIINNSPNKNYENVLVNIEWELLWNGINCILTELFNLKNKTSFYLKNHQIECLESSGNKYKHLVGFLLVSFYYKLRTQKQIQYHIKVVFGLSIGWGRGKGNWKARLLNPLTFPFTFPYPHKIINSNTA